MRTLVWLISLVVCYTTLALFIEYGVLVTVATMGWGVLSFFWLRLRGNTDLADGESLFEEEDYATSGMDMGASPTARGLARLQDRG